MDKKFEATLAHHQAGHLHEAEQGYRSILAEHPEHVLSLHNLGVVLIQTGRHQDALTLLWKVRAINPEYRLGHINAGHALLGLGRPADAEACFQTALSLDEHDAQTWFHLGTAAQSAGHTATAAKAYLKSTALAPQWPEPVRRLGLTQIASGDVDSALASFDRALALNPNDVPTLNSSALFLARLGRADDAADRYRRALAIAPHTPELYGNLGVLERERGRLTDAIFILMKGASLAPESAAIQNNLGLALAAAGRLAEAETAFRISLRLAPASAQTLSNLGNVLKISGRLDEAIDAFDNASAVDPNIGCNQSFLLRQTLCRWDHFEDSQTKITAALKREAKDISPFSILAMDTTPEEQLDCARHWAKRWTTTLPPQPKMDGATRTARLKIGYLSCDFRRHAVGYLLPDLFERHDRNGFELFAYSYGSDDGSPIRKRIAAASDHFVEIAALSDNEAAAKIRDNGINILIDLSGFTANARPQIPALRPAPVQISYLGYPGTMGASFIDYVIADEYLVPPGNESLYSEKILRLTDCYQPSDRHRRAKMLSRADCGIPDDILVLCCFSNGYKLTPSVFSVWTNILQATPKAVLWFSIDDETTRRNLRQEAKSRGVDPDRLIFASFADQETYLGRLAQADLFLDSFPYNAGATANDALWVGLPLLTCSGKTYVSRMAGSLLTAAGMPELITYSLEDYQMLAIDLLNTPGKLSAIRKKLALAQRTSPLFDIARYAKSLEAALHKAWHDFGNRLD